MSGSSFLLVQRHDPWAPQEDFPLIVVVVVVVVGAVGDIGVGCGVVVLE